MIRLALFRALRQLVLVPIVALASYYLMAALPAVARRISPAGDAYEYLAESIRDWPRREELAHRIGGAGWSAVRWRDLTLGVVTVHTARRRAG